MPAGAAVLASSRAIAPSCARSSCTPVPSRWAAISSSEARSSSTMRIAPPAPAAATPSSTGRYGVTGMRNSKTLPLPTSESSVSRPPKSSTIRRQSVRPRPGALLLHRPAAALLERLEDQLLVLGRNPDPRVADGHHQLAGLPSCAQRDGATGGSELHRVAEQVDDDLLEAELVGLHQADVVGHLHGELDAVLHGSLADDRDGVVQGGGHREDCRLQPHLARLDLGQVQDLVEQLQQVSARAVDVAEVLLLPLVERRRTCRPGARRRNR